jgi:hypothetical protein
MRRLVKSLLSWTLPGRPREAGALNSSTVADDPITTIRRRPSPDRRGLQWMGFTLVILFTVLAPWGGPCNRRSRPADPTTARLSTILGQKSESQPGIHGSDYGAGLPDMALDILDDEDDGEDFEGRIFLGQSHGFTPPSHGVPGQMVCDNHHDDSGRSARSTLLRC